ncbi:AzlD domain-containing protein [Vibrio sp. RE86]|uniref:AzlD domain-containing protein n=1 Tax=Vibrio sp. RE86 TaxID=2607605 RepID=UPI001493C42A|nr:AzlD domain-containing protein [Vibrio sp. RE86]NOH78820.1 AzlD domain-containing protein [Vibrio sp. RE86]
MTLNLELLILLMAAITFSCRYLFFMNSLPITLGPKVQALLKYTAPSVLTAMWVPIVFFGHETIEESFITSPFLYAGILTVIASLKIKNTLAVVVIGMSSFLLLQWLI